MLEKNYVYLVFLDGTAVELLTFGPFFNFLDLRRLVLVVDCLKKKRGWSKTAGDFLFASANKNEQQDPIIP